MYTYFVLLIVSSAEQILFMLLRSNRVRSDLKWMSTPEFGENFWDNSLVIRKWTPIPLSMEFRGVCIEGNVTTLSQYAHDLYFEKLDCESTAEGRHGQVPPRIVERIYAFWQTWKEKIPYTFCIVDFAVLDSGIKLIEVNPLVSID